MAEIVNYCRVESPVGTLLLAVAQHGLRVLHFDRGGLSQPEPGENWVESASALRPYTEQLEAYFQGNLREFTVALDLRGTAFQTKCWQALRRIPYGETRSYGELARDVGSPQAFRAVGRANHKNPVAIIVPCHRVIGADGNLTGYGGGIKVKEFLLRLEGANHPSLSLCGKART